MSAPEDRASTPCIGDIEMCAGAVLDRLAALAALESTCLNASPEEIEAARSTLAFDALEKARVLDRVIQGAWISDARRVAR
jgi:hypothetical protein